MRSRLRDLLTPASVDWLPRVVHRVAFTVVATAVVGVAGVVGRDYQLVTFCDGQTIEDNVVQQRCASMHDHVWPFLVPAAITFVMWSLVWWRGRRDLIVAGALVLTAVLFVEAFALSGRGQWLTDRYIGGP